MVEWEETGNGAKEWSIPLSGKMDGLWLEAEHLPEGHDCGEKLIVRFIDAENKILGGVEGVIVEKDGVRYMEVVSLDGGTLIEEIWEPWLDDEDKQKWVLPMGYEKEAYDLGSWLAKDLGVRKIFGWEDKITDTKMEHLEPKVKELLASGRKEYFLETGRIRLRGGMELRIDDPQGWEERGYFEMLLFTADGTEAQLIGELFHDTSESEVIDLSVLKRGEIKAPGVVDWLMRMCSELMRDWPERNKEATAVMVDVEDSLIYLSIYYLKYKYPNLRVWAAEGDHWGQFKVLDEERVSRLINYWLGF